MAEPNSANAQSGNETAALVFAARSGDRASLDALFQRYLPCVRRIAALRLGRRARDLVVLEDLVQESMLNAFLGLPDFEPRSEGSFRSWLARIVENNLRDGARHARALKRGAGAVRTFADCGTSVLTDSVLKGSGQTPSQVAVGRELEQRVEDAMLSLDERDRHVIELRRLCEMDYSEIAEELGLAEESSARSLFSRAMVKLSAKI